MPWWIPSPQPPSKLPSSKEHWHLHIVLLCYKLEKRLVIFCETLSKFSGSRAAILQRVPTSLYSTNTPFHMLDDIFGTLRSTSCQDSGGRKRVRKKCASLSSFVLLSLKTCFGHASLPLIRIDFSIPLLWTCIVHRLCF